MGRKMSGGEKLFLFGIGAVGLYYLTAGPGRENNAALIPNAIEDRIDLVIDTLNAKVGKNWGDRATGGLKFSLRQILPEPLVALVDVVYAVEQNSKRVYMASNTKRQRAAATAIALRIGLNA